VEVGKAVLALNLVDAELDLPEGVLVILVEVSEGELKDATLQEVSGVLETRRTVDKGLADVTGVEDAGRLDVVPV
jgi:hypothetical protein